MPAGRPTDYDPAMCDRLLELGMEGASKAEMAHALGVARSTFSLWEQTHPEFSEAVKDAVEASQGWWESEGRKATFGKVPGFNATSFIFNMKNRFPSDWKDKQEVDQNIDVNLKAQSDADRFTRSIAGIASRSGTTEGDSES